MGYTSAVMCRSIARRGSAFAWAIAACAIGRGAHADPPTPARVRVDAPADCATTASFWSALARRTDRLRAAEPSEASDAAMIDVTIRRDDARYSVRGELHVARAGERASTRKIGGASCSEVTDGLSLVAALAFDPAARIDRTADPTPPASTANDAPPPPAPPAPPSAPSSPPADDEKGAPSPRSAPAEPSEAPDASPFSSSWRIGLGGSMGALAVAAPGASLAYGGFADLEKDRAGFAPSFRLGVVHAEGTADSSTVHADLAWTLARASVCPARADLSRTVRARPCLSLDAGALSADPRGATTSQPRTRPWVAPGLAMRILWEPARFLFIEGQLSAAVPLVRDELVIDPSLSLYRAPVLVGSGEIAAGVRFP